MNVNWTALWLTAAVAALMAATTSAGGTVELTLVRYYNRLGLDASKDHCDSFFTLFRTSKCDLYFTVELDAKGPSGAGPAGRTVVTKVYHDRNTVHFGRQLSSSESNPIVIRFDKWRGRANLRVRAIDHDHVTAHDDVDDISATIAARADGTQRSHQVTGKVHLSDSHLAFRLRVTCDRHFHAADCSRRCEPRNDARGHFRCTAAGQRECLAGWRGLSGGCLERDPCSPSPCLHGGNCTKASPIAYTCACPPGYHGRRCEVRWAPCELHDHCLHGGRCVNRGAEESTCQCPPGWAGRFCERDVNECAGRGAARCQNGGTCFNAPGGFSCWCFRGWTGRLCERDLDECAMGLEDAPACTHNGNCTNAVGGFECACERAFNGSRCELFVGDATPAQHEEERWHRSRLRAVWVVGPVLVAFLLATAVLIMCRRLRAKNMAANTSVHLHKDDLGPRLEFKNSVYDSLDLPANSGQFSSDKERLQTAMVTDAVDPGEGPPGLEARTGMINGTFISDKPDPDSRAPPRAPTSFQDPAPARQQQYKYSSLADASPEPQPGRSVAVRVLIDTEDGFIQLPGGDGAAPDPPPPPPALCDDKGPQPAPRLVLSELRDDENSTA